MIANLSGMCAIDLKVPYIIHKALESDCFSALSEVLVPYKLNAMHSDCINILENVKD